MASPEPNENQLEVLKVIIAFVEDRGYQPSYDEVANATNTTKASVMSRLKALEKKGFVSLAGERAISLSHVKFKAYTVD